MNIIMTTSGYILRFKDLISAKFNGLLNSGTSSHQGFAMAEARDAGFTKENALHYLLDQGKSFHEAELVIATLEEWGLELDQVTSMNFEVHGNSVWIKAD
ncbi:MAG: hypothetical protein ABWY16_05925 [Pedobacter sp.]|uniref:hypothetical protein n=1 Tax=Pedobacter sp. TaxID=1411316 RepID=UPI00339A8135